MALHHDQLVRRCRFSAHTRLARLADADAFSLPDGVEGKTMLLADRLSIHHRTIRAGLPRRKIQELANAASPMKQIPVESFLAWFGRPRASRPLRRTLRFLEIAEREHSRAPLRLVSRWRK